MAQTVLVVDDEQPIADILKFNLEKAGYRVLIADNGKQAVELALSAMPDVVLLDIMLPELDGFAVCEAIRARSAVPIIMLTAKEAEADKIRGLQLGADDYVTKPFSPDEVLARIQANLRRVNGMAGPATQGGTLYCGDLVIEPDNHRVYKRGQEVELTTREFALLAFLAQRPGQVFSREYLLKEVWGYAYPGDIRTVDVTVRRLREKIEDKPSEPVFLLTKRGAGYYFRKF